MCSIIYRLCSILSNKRGEKERDDVNDETNNNAKNTQTDDVNDVNETPWCKCDAKRDDDSLPYKSYTKKIHTQKNNNRENDVRETSFNGRVREEVPPYGWGCGAPSRF